MVERPQYSADERGAIDLARRLLEDVFYKGNVEGLSDVALADCVIRTPLPGISTDADGFRRVVDAFHAAVPGFDVVIDDMLAQGNVAVLRWTAFHPPDGGQRDGFTGVAYVVANSEEGLLQEVWFAFDGVDALGLRGEAPDHFPAE